MPEQSITKKYYHDTKLYASGIAPRDLAPVELLMAPVRSGLANLVVWCVRHLARRVDGRRELSDYLVTVAIPAWPGPKQRMWCRRLPETRASRPDT